MNYTSFCESLGSMLLDRFPPGVRISRERIQKNNNTYLDAFCIPIPGFRCSPVIYLRPLYEEWIHGCPMEQIADSVMETLAKQPPFSSDILSRLTNLEQAKPYIAFRLVSKKANEPLLSGVPWLSFLDFAILFFVDLTSESGVQASALIRNQQMELWNLSPEELWEISRWNTPRLFPPSVRLLQELLPESERNADAEAGNLLSAVRVLTNRSETYGASCLLYEGLLSALSDHLDSDLLILPSSIHEVLILPDSVDLDYSSLRAMIRQVNRTALESEDFLSDELYLWSSGDPFLKICPSGACSDKAETDGKKNP